jgi:hypothetical protein
MGAVVTMHLPGTPGDFLLTLGQGELAPEFVIICGHGDGIVFGEYAPGIDTSCLVERTLPARALAGKIELPGRVVLSTACDSGAEDYGRAFLEGGVRAILLRCPVQTVPTRCSSCIISSTIFFAEA